MYPIDDWLAHNYETARLERGLTWVELAAEFDRQDAPRLAAWAREHTDPVVERVTPRRETATDKSPRRRTTEATP